jgi:type VI secretion system secreted protein Hcp
MAHVDYFLKIDGIDGESFQKGHEKEIEVDSFSWGAGNAAAAATGGGRAIGKVQFKAFNFGAISSKASPPMLLAVTTGRHIKFALLTGQRPSEEGTGQDFYKIKLTDVLVSSYEGSAASSLADNQENVNNNQPMDQVSLNFAKIEFTFTSQTQIGSIGDQTTANWDLDKDQGF